MNIHDQALAILDRDGMAKGAYDNDAGGHCTMGCYRAAAREQYLYLHGHSWDTTLLLAYREFREANGLDLDIFAGSVNIIATWNDAAEREPVHLREAFKKASELHEERARKEG